MVQCGAIREHYPCEEPPDGAMRHPTAAFSMQSAAEESMQKSDAGANDLRRPNDYIQRRIA